MCRQLARRSLISTVVPHEAKRRSQMRNCASENLEISGFVLCTPRNDGDGYVALGLTPITSAEAAMSTPGTFSFDAPGDAARAAELRRVKVLATLVLVGTLALFAAAKALLPLHPVFGFIAAFAEAATIGGLADWYAVVALFRRPFGLQIPHTAIIQSNQHRIA